MRFARMPTMAGLLMLWGCGGGGPGESEIESALLNDFLDGIEEQLSSMTAMVGERRATEAVFSNYGISDLSDVELDGFSLEDLRELDNGDYLAKTVYTLQRGDKLDKRIGRLTLTRLEGEWEVIDKEFLD